MQTAVDLILSHIEQGSAILVYGDYDVDGVTATASMRSRCSAGWGRWLCLPPHRIEDGYGLGVETLHRCIGELPSQPDHHRGLRHQLRRGRAGGRALGIDVIVTDHHEPAAEGVAEACAIVNPKLGGGPEEIRMLAGVGGFQGLPRSGQGGPPAPDGGRRKLDLKTFMELVAVGTVADIVPLLKETASWSTTA